MEKAGSFVRNWGDVVVSLVTAAITGWEMYLNTRGESVFADEPGLPVAVGWGVFVLLVLFAIIRRQLELITIKNSLAIINLRDFDFEIKIWKNARPYIAIYIELKNEPHSKAINANAEKVYPQIIWEDLISGQVLDSNPGRWFIPNREREQIIELHTVNLEANGKTKKLHFGAIAKRDSCIRAIWRDDDDGYQKNVFRNDHNHKITISLKDINGASAEFLFVLSKHMTQAHPFYVFQLERIDKDGKAIGRPKRFALKDLPNKIDEVKGLERST